MEFATKADAEAYNPTTAPDFLSIAGYTAAGDLGGALYKKVAAAPAHVGKLQIAEGSWYEIAEAELDSRMVGLPLFASNAASAFEDFLIAATTLDVPAIVGDGQIYDFPAGTVSLPSNLVLRMIGAVLRRTTDVLIPLFESSSTNNIVLIGGTFSNTRPPTAPSITNNTALFLNGSSNVRITDIRVEGAFYVGVYFRDCLNASCENTQVFGVVNRACYVAAATYTENISVSDCLFDGYELGTTNRLTNHIVNTNAFGTGSGRNITFTNCTSRHGSTNPTGEGFGFSDRITDQRAVNCFAYDCPTGFTLQEANGNPVLRVQLVNCSAENCSNNGYFATGANIFSIVGSRATGCGTGFNILNSFNFTIASCIAENCTAGGFSYDGNTSVGVISGNLATVNVGTGFYSANTASYLNAKGNIAVSNTTSYIWNAFASDTTGNI